MAYITWLRGKLGRQKTLIVYGTVILRDERQRVLRRRGIRPERVEPIRGLRVERLGTEVRLAIGRERDRVGAAARAGRPHADRDQ